MFKSKKLLVSLCSIVLCFALVLSASIFASAEEVIVEEYKNTELEFERIYGTSADHNDPWQSEGYLEQDPSKGSYKLYTNSYCIWWQADAFDFAYKKLDFSYGTEGKLVLETTLNSFNASMNENAGAGIMIRTSLSPSAANVFLHVRPGETMVIYRASQGAVTVVGKTQAAPAYPLGMRMELKNNKLTCYIKQKGQSEFGKFATIPFVSGNTVYAGLAAYTVNELDMALADYSGFHAYVQTPEGAEKVDPDASSSESTSSGTTSSEDEIKLPDDPPVNENVLLRETFTSGKYEYEKQELPTKINWDYNSKFPPIIETNADNTNRYLYNWMETQAYLIGGDQEWTDYTMTTDVTFTPDFSNEGTNKFYILARHHDVSMYGAHDYVIGFEQSLGKQYVFMGRRNSTSTQYTQAAKVGKGVDSDIVQTEYNWLPSNEQGEITAKVKIKCFDNVITVWIDDVLVLRYTDNTQALNAKGSIGFVFLECAVKIDNIQVVEETDLLGGSYDNEICGNWNEEIPSLVQEYIDKKYYGYSAAPYVKNESK